MVGVLTRLLARQLFSIGWMGIVAMGVDEWPAMNLCSSSNERLEGAEL